MPKPLSRPKIVKKRRAPFKRHFSNRFMRVGESWRKPKGIDSKVRRRFRGALKMPKIGYGSDKKTRHMLPNGFYKFIVRNSSELDLLLMHNRTYAAQIAHNVGVIKRKQIIERARQLDIKVLNPQTRLREEQDE